MDKVSELRKALTKRGAKAKIARETGLTVQALNAIQRGKNTPLLTTRRLIARALGFPDDYFLESDGESPKSVKRRLVIEWEFPADYELTDDELVHIRKAIEESGKQIIQTIKNVRRGKS